MKLSLRRKFKGSKYTIGDLSIDGTFFCNTIEDVIRELPDSCPNTSRWIPCKCKEKVYARTAIPTGTYKVTLEYSPKFKRKMPYLHGVPHFLGILIHWGNTEDDSGGWRELCQGQGHQLSCDLQETLCPSRKGEGYHH